MRKRRIAGWAGVALLALVAVAAIAVWALLSSDRVARRIIQRGLASAGETVQIGRISGQLRGPLILEDIRVSTPAYTALIDSVLLEWTPIGLVRREVRVDRLHATGVHVVLPDSAPVDTTPADTTRPSLPFAVLLGDVVVRDISVDAPGDVGLRDGWARLEGRAVDYRLRARGRAFTPQLDSVPFEAAARGNLVGMDLSRAAVDLLEGSIRANGAVAWWPRVAWNLGVGAEEVRPALLLEDPDAWPGSLSAVVRTAGHLDSAGPHAKVIVDSLGGELRGEPVSGTAAFELRQTTIELASLDASWGTAAVDATGTIGETLDLRFDARIGNLATLLPDARGTVAASGSVTGPRDAARVTADARGSNIVYGTNRLARFEGTVDVGLAPDGRADVDLRGSGAAVGTLLVDRLALATRGTRTAHTITADATGGEVALDLRARGGLRETTWSGTLQQLAVSTPETGRWALQAPTAISAGAELVTVDRLCLASDPSRVCAGGSWRGNLDWRLRATIERFPLALIDSLVPDTSAGGARALAGTLEGDIDMRAAGGRLDGLATFALQDAALLYPIPGDTAPGRFVFDTAGAEVRAGADGVALTSAFRFAADDGTPVGRLDLTASLPRFSRLGRPLGPEPLQARLVSVIDDLSIAGVLSTQTDSLTGRLELDASAAGTVEAPEVDATLALEEIVAWLAGSRVARGAVDATLAGRVARDRSLSGTLDVVPRGVIYEFPLADVRRTVAIDSGGLQVTAGAGGVEARLALGASDSAGGRLATIFSELGLPEYTRAGEPLPPQPFTLRFTADVADLAVLQTVVARFDTLTGTLQAELTADGTIGAPSVEGTATVRDLLALLPQGGAIVGGLDATLTADVGADSSLTGSLAVAPADLALRLEEGGDGELVRIDGPGLSATVGADGLQGEFEAVLREAAGSTAGELTASLALPGYRRLGQPLEGQPLTGRVDAEVSDLAFVEGLTAMVDSIAGRLDLAATLAGTADEPRVTGGLEVRDAAVRLPLLGVLYHDIQLTARGDDSETLTVNGTLASGGGTLEVTGNSPLVPTNASPAVLQIEGREFEAVRNAELHAVITPDLTVRVSTDTVAVEGSVAVPLARLELEDIPETAVAPSDDIVFVRDTASTLAGPRAIAARVRVVLGDSVVFRGFNFNAELGGTLSYTQVPERIPTASGELVIEQGRYRAYGQDLTITDGALAYAGGPVNDPGLNIRAIRTADDGTVAGLQIGGTLQDPTVTIFSEPAMAQSRALAYIILGRPPGEGTSGGPLLSRAATSLGLRGGNALAGNLGRGLGLSEAGIETEDGAQSATFVAGAYLAPNVYVSYGVGLFDPITRLRLRYELSDRWAVQAERGAATGADVLFKTERGQ